MRTKIKGILLLFASAVICTLVFSLAYAKDDDLLREKKFKLPASLVEVENEAFLNTAPELVCFNEKLYRVGNRAFACSWTIKGVFVSPSTEIIAGNAFEGDLELTIFGIKGSYAEEYAKRNRFPFQNCDLCKDILQSISSINFTLRAGSFIHNYYSTIKRMTSVGRSFNEGRSMRPQERIDIHNINYRFP